MAKYWSSVVEGLEPYVPGEQPKVEGLIKLNTNENPYGPSSKVLEAINEQSNAALRLYPDPNADMLKEAIAAFYGIDEQQVFVGNGSDEVLAHGFQCFFKQQAPLLFPDISYSFYPVYCGLYEINYKEIPLRESFELVMEDYFQDNGGIIFANPNAPTGRYVELDDIERLLQNNRKSVVAIDEAYIDFGGESAVRLIQDYDNLLVIQTLSKSRSLAGLRVGFALGDGKLIEALERVKNSFNSYPLDRLAIYGAAASFRDEEYFKLTRSRIMKTRQWLIKMLEKLGFTVIPSAANFVFARNESVDAGELSAALRRRNILVRHFAKPRIEQFLRITVGTDEECEKLIEALGVILDC